MSLKKLPQIENFAELEKLEPRPSIVATQRWQPGLRVENAAGPDETVIDIFDQIGKDPWTGEGVSAADIAQILGSAKNVVVNMNSPGGNFFQGTAIYNLLAQHPHQVTVNVLGLAASAASIIAMAGDRVLMGPASFMMIHNAQAVGVGDRHDMQSVQETLTSIDHAIRDLYVAHTGKQANKISQMMDDETWLNAKDAIANKFADGLIDRPIAEDPAIQNMAHPLASRRLAEAIFADAGKTRSQQRELVTALKGGPGPIDNRTPSSDSGVAAIRDSLRSLASEVSAGTPRAADMPTTPRAGLDQTLSRLADKLPG